MTAKRFDDDIWLLNRISHSSEYELHLAFWPQEDQRVLIKSVKAQADPLKTKKIEERLLKEASTLEEFWSPYFPKVYDIRKKEDGTLYLILQYFEGVSLRQYIDINMENGLSINAIKKIDQEISYALTYLHNKKNVIHFDLSPENIIISPENSIHLIDFEDAKIIGKEINSHNIRGKLAYMAPELRQGLGEIKSTPYLDLYAQKVVFKEMLALCPRWERMKMKLSRESTFNLERSMPLNFSFAHKSIFKSTSVVLSVTLVTLLFLAFGPLGEREIEKIKPNRVSLAKVKKKNIKKSHSLKKKIVSRSPAIPRKQIVKRRSSAIKKRPTRKKNFREKFQQVLSKKDQQLQGCLTLVKGDKKELVLRFVLEEKTGKLLRLKTPSNLGTSPEVFKCVSKIYKNLNYPVHPSSKEVEITQRFVLTQKL